MSQDFSELIKYLDEKFTDVNQKFNKLEKSFTDLQSSVDNYAKRADTYFQEMVMLSHKVDKLEKWVNQIADKVGVKLEDR